MRDRIGIRRAVSVRFLQEGKLISFLLGVPSIKGVRGGRRSVISLNCRIGAPWNAVPPFLRLGVTWQVMEVGSIHNITLMSGLDIVWLSDCVTWLTFVVQVAVPTNVQYESIILRLVIRELALGRKQ